MKGSGRSVWGKNISKRTLKFYVFCKILDSRFSPLDGALCSLSGPKFTLKPILCFEKTPLKINDSHANITCLQNIIYITPEYFSLHADKTNPLSELTRQETVRWLIMTVATAHQRCFSQASKKTIPQNMWSRIMAIVIKAEKGEKWLPAGVWRSLQFLYHCYLRTGSSTGNLHVSPQSPAPQSQPGCSPQRMLRSWIQNRGQTLRQNKMFHSSKVSKKLSTEQ